MIPHYYHRRYLLFTTLVSFEDLPTIQMHHEKVSKINKVPLHVGACIEFIEFVNGCLPIFNKSVQSTPNLILKPFKQCHS